MTLVSDSYSYKVNLTEIGKEQLKRFPSLSGIWQRFKLSTEKAHQRQREGRKH